MNIDKYIEISKNRKFDTQGGNSKCHIFDEHVLLNGRYNKKEIDEVIKKTNDAKLLGASISQILEYIIEDELEMYNNGYMLQERANGKPIHKTTSNREINMAKTEEEKNQIKMKNVSGNLEELEVLNNVKQEQYDKFIKDWLNIKKCGLKVDPSKTDNFFYDKDQGFTFIDVDSGENINMLETEESKKTFCNELMVVMINSSLYYSMQMKDNDKKAVEEKVAQFIPKISSSLEKNDISNKMFDEFMNDKYPNISNKYMNDKQKFFIGLSRNVKNKNEINDENITNKQIDISEKEI